MIKTKPPTIDENKITTESPFVEFCKIMDNDLRGQPIEAWEAYALDLWQNDPEYITRALLDDFSYRARFQMNVIMSIEGPQGEFKSLFGLWWSYKLGEIFGLKFDIEKNLYAAPTDLDLGLKESAFRSTHFLDEQPNQSIGPGSRRMELDLVAYEEKMRYTQRNIIYASPTIRDHAHYFVFRSYSYTRVNNQKCACNPNCLKEKWKTECGIPFWERTGYPSSMTFVVETKRKIDNVPVVRGLVTIPMPTPETLKAYDLIKNKNILKYDSREDNSHQYLNVLSKEFFDSEKEKMIMLIGNKGFKIIQKKVRGEYVPVKIPTDTRKYRLIPTILLKTLLFNFLKSKSRLVNEEVKMVLGNVSIMGSEIVSLKNAELDKERLDEFENDLGGES